jgi:outer membrane protein TolC
MNRPLLLGVATLLLLSGRPAHALQPLSEFTTAARAANLDARESASLTEQREHELQQTEEHLLPTLSAVANYTRNEYDASVTLPSNPAVAGSPLVTRSFQPLNQENAVVGVSASVLDIGAWRRVGVAKATRAAQRAHRRATELDVDSNVTHAYYQVVGDEAVLRASEQALHAAEESLAFIEHRAAAGVASELDHKRELAEVEQRRQSIADAEYSLAVARRSLETLTGLVPTAGALLESDDLHEEAPLDVWEARLSALPQVEAARLDARASQEGAGVTEAALFPTVTAAANETFTNAAGFGSSPFWAVGGSVAWNFDLSVFPAIRAQESAADAARMRAERTTKAARDQIHTAWQAVRLEIAKSRAARAQIDASREASRMAHDKYSAGTATFLDVVVADRDLFSAEVSAISADADLLYGRAFLHLSAGESASGGRR